MESENIPPSQPAEKASKVEEQMDMESDDEEYVPPEDCQEEEAFEMSCEEEPLEEDEIDLEDYMRFKERLERDNNC